MLRNVFAWSATPFHNDKARFSVISDSSLHKSAMAMIDLLKPMLNYLTSCHIPPVTLFRIRFDRFNPCVSGKSDP